MIPADATWAPLDSTTVDVLWLADTLDNPEVGLPGFEQVTEYDTAVLDAAMALSKARSLAP